MEELSICIVAYNEETFLPKLLENIKNQVYPHKDTGIVLVNSISTDKTRKIMEKFQQQDYGFCSVQVIDNPKKTQAAGWNVAIQNAKGKVILRIDAHTMIPPDFSKKIMEDIAAGEDIVGGARPCIIEQDTSWAKTLLQAENSMFGSSINSSRKGNKKTYVKTMFHAAYWQEVFQKAGGFNENLFRTEDNEMHYRIRKCGYKLYYDPEIISYQYARKDLKSMIKQKWNNGFWIGLTLAVCPKCIFYYHLIPCVFVLAVCFTSILYFWGFWQLAAAMWITYAVFAVVSTMINIIKDGFHIVTLLLPFIFLTLHVSYGAGTLAGIINIPFRRKKNLNYVSK